MDLKTLFTETRSYLKAIPELNWVDADKGQIDRYQVKPAVSFPCALIEVSLPKTQNMNHTTQQCTGMVMVRIAFNYTGEANGEVDDELLAESLEYLDIIQKVYIGLQAKTSGVYQYSPLERTGLIPEPPRTDGMKVIRMAFSTTFLDTSAKVPN
jgi:hypothetical protein